MAESVKNDRRFSPDEVEQILKVAARRDGEAAGSGRKELSVADLERIASEAGIDPARIQEAIAELEAKPRGPIERLLGAPTEIHLQRTLPVSLTPADLEALAVEIRSGAGEVGHVSLVGNTLTWTSASFQRPGAGQITISSLGGETSIRMDAFMGQIAGGLFGGIGGGMGVGAGTGVAAAVMGVTRDPMLATLVAGAFTGASLLLARTIYSAIAVSRRRRLDLLMQRLTDRIAQLTSVRAP
jgi:hypothetical protein